MLSSLVIVLIIVIMSIGCESTTSKNLKSAKESTEEPNVNLNKVIKESQEEIKATAKVDWEKFNKDSQTAIKERQIQIEELRGEISKISKKEQQKFNSILDSLEHKNKNLKERLAQINKKIKTNIEHLNESDEVLKTAFESVFVRDMNELIAGIRDFWKTNSKNK